MGRLKKYNREDVIQKAMKAFWDNGYENTSTRLLEEKMGINQNTIYFEFKSKEGLFIESLNCYENLLKCSIMSPIINSNGDISDINIFFKSFITSVKSGESPNGCLFGNTSLEFGFSNDRIKKRLNDYYRFLYSTFFDLLTKAKSNGSIDNNSDVGKLSNYLVGCTNGLSVMVKVLDETAVNEYIECVILSIK